jgi:Phage Mu protein F like protein
MAEIDGSRLSFTEAIEYFAQKTNLDTDSWIEGQGIVQDAAFTVAAAKGQLLQDIRDAVARGQSEGQSVQEFLKTFDTIADRYSDNWELKGDKAWRGQLIYEQNIRNAYQAGRYAQMTQPDVLKLRPYWQWRHGDSRAPRPAHLALDNKVFLADDLPFSPPAGFGCRCQVFSLSQRDLDRKGLEVESLKRGDEIQYVDPGNGTTRTVKLLPDKGFENQIGKSTPEQRAKILRRLDPDLKKAVQRESGMNWKPMMSKAEAEEYTRDSYYQGKDFYHGTSQEAADSITIEGARMQSESVNTYGEGFYLAFEQNTAIDYAKLTTSPSVLTAKVNVKNPRKFRDSIDFDNFLIENNIPADDLQSKAASKLLISQGFDAVEVGGNRILVIIFKTTQIAVFQSKKL